VYESINTWHVKEPIEASGVGAYFCICFLHYSPKYKILFWRTHPYEQLVASVNKLENTQIENLFF
jgi:hypothetical protein